GDERGQELINLLKQGKYNEDFNYIALFEIKKNQAVSRDEMTTVYLNFPAMRMFYQFKTIVLRQVNTLFNEAAREAQIYSESKAGYAFYYSKALMRMLFILTLCGVGADALKDLLYGRMIDIKDKVISNLLNVILINKFMFYRAKQTGSPITSFAMNFLIPPIPIGDNLYRDYKDVKSGKRKVWQARSVQSIPIAGRPYYWWFGGGRIDEENAEKRRRAEKRKKSRL
ncbi:MAG: hypothetical protein LBU09_01260, partial [Endomicrobium sp.]|nr:hypothetical protein [Endomicrobium sp.]